MRRGLLGVLVYQAGRSLTYAWLGGLAGLIGAGLSRIFTAAGGVLVGGGATEAEPAGPVGTTGSGAGPQAARATRGRRRARARRVRIGAFYHETRTARPVEGARRRRRAVIARPLAGHQLKWMPQR